MKDGARCAELAISSFLAAVYAFSGRAPPTRILREASIRANRTVFEAFHGDGGSTLTAFLLQAHTLTVCNIGDSRAFVVSTNDELRQITTDDTIAGQLRRLGEESSEYLGIHSRLVQYIGMGADLEPQVTQLNTEDLKSVIISSDGAHGLPQGMFAGIAKHATTPKMLVDRLLDISIWLGGRDNATVLSLALTHFPPENEITLVELWNPSSCLEIILDAASHNQIGLNWDRPGREHRLLDKAPSLPNQAIVGSRKPKLKRRRPSSTKPVVDLFVGMSDDIDPIKKRSGE